MRNHFVKRGVNSQPMYYLYRNNLFVFKSPTSFKERKKDTEKLALFKKYNPSLPNSTKYLSILGNKLLEMFPGSRNVQLREGSGDLRPSSGHDHHDVCVASEHVNVCSKLGITNLHAPKLRLRFGATDLKLLDDI